MRGRGIPAALAGGVLAAAIALAPCPAFCQQVKGVFAPYVSRLAAEPAGHQVKLTWKDSTDVEGTCVVYRHTAEITPRTAGGALVVGRVSSGVEYFLDSPPDRQESFYAVLLEECDELWDEVRKRRALRDVGRMRQELIQIAAMALRFITDVCEASDHV